MPPPKTSAPAPAPEGDALEGLPEVSPLKAQRALDKSERLDADDPGLVSATAGRENSHWTLVRNVVFVGKFLGYALVRQQAKAQLKLASQCSHRFDRLEGEGDMDL